MVRDSAPLKRDCNEQDRWRRRLDDDDLEGKDQARVTGKVLGGEIIRYLKATPTCLGEGDSYCRYIGRQERMVRDSAPLKSDCNEQDRWRRRLRGRTKPG